MRRSGHEPFYDGGHQAFFDGSPAHSRHEVTWLGLPADKRKWRMQHVAVMFATMIAERFTRGKRRVNALDVAAAYRDHMPAGRQLLMPRVHGSDVAAEMDAAVAET